MLIFKHFLEKMYYIIDILKISKPIIKIENFSLYNQNIFVYYRVGSCLLKNKKELNLFTKDFFDMLSFYDKQRVIKFNSFKLLIQSLFKNEIFDKKSLLDYIKKEINNEQLF